MIEIKSLSSGSVGNSYLVTDGFTNLLLEAGISWKDILKRTEYITIDGCLVSHNHLDHAKAVKDILRMGIPVYMSEGCKKALDVDRYNLITIKAKETFNIGTWIITAFDVKHDVEEPLGFLLYSKETKERLVFITDSMYSKYLFKDIDYWMLEANHSIEILDKNIKDGVLFTEQKRRVQRTHMSLETCLGILEANDLSKTKMIYLIHLSDKNSDEVLFKEIIEKKFGKVVVVA